MKQAGIVYFTTNGGDIAEKVEDCLISKGFQVRIRNREDDKNLGEWTKNAMENFQLVIFISAAAIGVRMVAPYLRSKTVDPPVIAIDDNGKFIIPLVAGHMGGANKMAKILAEKLGGIAVITTATDVNGKIAIDSWAKENNLVIEDMNAAKECAMRLLEGRPVGLWSIVPVECQEEGIELAILNKFRYEFGINISWESPKMFRHELKLVPKGLVLGLGCRRGTTRQAIETVVKELLMEKGICFSGISTVATIDLKSDEIGLLEFVEKYNLELKLFSADELGKVPGDFPKSEFVQNVTGVDNVCQRAAMCAEPDGHVIVEKTARYGVTVSVVVPRKLREETLYVK